MENRSRIVALAVVLGLISLSATAQVLPLGKVSDPAARLLQQRHIQELQQLSSDFSKIHFPYSFYFSQVLDIDEARQKQLPQGSLHFENFNGKTVLAITGNYYISYSSTSMTGNQRARKTYEDVIFPLLKVAVARIDRNVSFDGYAFEVSHHVRRQVLKVNTEGPENVMIMFPRAVAERLVRAADVESRQAAVLESEVYLNGEPLSLWLTGDDAPADIKDHYLARHDHGANTKKTLNEEPAEPGTLVSSSLVPESTLLNQIRDRQNTVREISPAELAKLQTTYEPTLQRLTTDLKQEGHFVDYAPPAFIAFHNGAYLQLNISTELESPASSQYSVAALAFDTHISHMLRAVSKYFHDNPRFEGIDFSTTVRQSGRASSQSVEFVVPFSALLCYEKFDCTGQEVINRSIVLINGERAALDLQRAEAEIEGR
jgi:hypothetical protein